MEKKETGRRLLLWLCAFVFLFCAAGCGSAPKGEDREIVLAAARDLVPGKKDPYYSTMILKTWESLVGISDDGRAIPQLAESWESNEDCTEWIFHLKKGVTFQDGEPFDAAAAAENFYRVTHMGYKPSPFYGYSVERIYPGLIKTEVDDEHTIHLYFRAPVPMLIYRMAGWGSAMFSPQCFDRETGDFTEVAQGTGPFRIVEQMPAQYTVLERFEGYYGEQAKTKRIRIRVLPAPEARYSAMKSGEIQGVVDLGGLTPMLTEELLKDGDFHISVAKSTISHYLTLNGTRFPFRDERMKKAINLIIDRDKIVRYYFCGYGVPTMSFLNSANPFARSYPVRRDAEEAKRLARSVLGDRMVKVRFLLPQYGAARYPYKLICEFLQAELKEIGVDADIVMVDSMTWKKALRHGDFDLSIGTRGLGNLDPTSLLEDLFASDGATNMGNHLGYGDASVDEYFQKLPHVYDIEERTKLYDAIQDWLIERPAVAPLLEDRNIAVSSKDISGYDAAVYGSTLEKMHWAKEDAR